MLINLFVRSDLLRTAIFWHIRIHEDLPNICTIIMGDPDCLHVAITLHGCIADRRMRVHAPLNSAFRIYLYVLIFDTSLCH
jgi:hypothetical protein